MYTGTQSQLGARIDSKLRKHKHIPVGVGQQMRVLIYTLTVYSKECIYIQQRKVARYFQEMDSFCCISAVNGCNSVDDEHWN